MWSTLLPIAGQVLGGSGGGGGLAGLLGGSKTEQTVSQESSLLSVVSLNNTIGQGSARSGAVSPSVSQSQQTSSGEVSPAPAYGATFGPDYTPGSLSAAEGEQPAQAGFNPVFLVIGAAALGVFVFYEG